jgi:D-alanyl-lipoteichoic acid acyltransferase DltB (MBOAT superfamily)
MIELLPLPALWALFYVLGRIPRPGALTFRRGLMVAASIALLFGAAGPATCVFYVLLGVATVLGGLWLARARDGSARRAGFVLMVAAVVALIAVYLTFRVYFQKYFVSLPSLSYLGFRGIALLVTAYSRGGVNLGGGLMQMLFMPVMMMGPITRAENFRREVRDDLEVLRRLAYAFPMLIGGRLMSAYVLKDVIVLGPLPVWRYWLGALANSLDFYLTFAGYTHLIIGLGLLAGFRLPENFDHPYLSTSISEFWKRWHMSLSFWIRDYVYIPLGGNRRGLARKCLNLIVAMGICGVWHGLELHYLLWGLYHGALLACESVMSHFGWQPLRRTLGPAYTPVKTAIVFGLVTFSWLLFRYPMDQLALVLRGLVP